MDKELGISFLLLLITSTYGAPTMDEWDSNMTKLLSAPPKWQNPCGCSATESYPMPTESETPMPKTELIQSIITEAAIGLDQTKLFCNDYVTKTLNYGRLGELDNFKYEWLPSLRQIPKKIHEDLAMEYLESLELNTTLLATYEYMQRFAVGLEQIVWDQEYYKLDFISEFKKTQNGLGSILCELQNAMAELCIPQCPDITRDVMPYSIRKEGKSDTYRNLRDWIIFRDYINALEYVLQVFNHLRNREEL